MVFSAGFVEYGTCELARFFGLGITRPGISKRVDICLDKKKKKKKKAYYVDFANLGQ